MSDMDKLQTIAKCTGVVLGALFSPAIVVFGVPFAYGIAGDIITTAGPLPCELAAEAAVGLLVWRHLTRWPLSYAATPKSIS